MFKFLTRNQRRPQLIKFANIATEITTIANETVLQSAERNDVYLPHKCRVGGCGSCKCKLVSGKIKPLTDFSYVLSKEEMQQGFILACQSVPQNDLEIEVNTQHKLYQRYLAEQKVS